jgi:hypothetical protein
MKRAKEGPLRRRAADAAAGQLCRQFPHFGHCRMLARVVERRHFRSSGRRALGQAQKFEPVPIAYIIIWPQHFGLVEEIKNDERDS